MKRVPLAEAPKHLFGARSFFRGYTPENKPDNLKTRMNEDVSPRLYLLSKKVIFQPAI